MNALEKEVILTIDGLQSKLNKPLTFYVNDKVRLAFTVKEFDYVLVNGYSKSKTLNTLTPMGGILSIETSFGVDTIEPVDIIGDNIYFELDSKYTGCAGKYNAQLFFMNEDGYQKAMPPFSFTVHNTINEDLDGNIRKEVTFIVNDRGECLLNSTNELIVFK